MGMTLKVENSFRCITSVFLVCKKLELKKEFKKKTKIKKKKKEFSQSKKKQGEWGGLTL